MMTFRSPYQKPYEISEISILKPCTTIKLTKENILTKLRAPPHNSSSDDVAFDIDLPSNVKVRLLTKKIVQDRSISIHYFH